MLNIFRYLKQSVGAVVCIMALLVLQAYCDLSLPTYTSKLVDVGISKNGIEESIPKSIRESSLEQLELFLDNDDIKTVEKAYKATKDDVDGDVIYELEEKNSDKLKELKNILEKPITLFGLLSSISDEDMQANIISDGEMELPDKDMRPVEEIFDEEETDIESTDESEPDTESISESEPDTESISEDEVKFGTDSIDYDESAELLDLMDSEVEIDTESVEQNYKSAMSVTVSDDESDSDVGEDDENALGIDTQKMAVMVQAMLNPTTDTQDRIDMLDEFIDQFGNMKDSITEQMSATYIKDEYEAVGRDLESYQMNYLVRTGLKMLAISLTAMLAAILVGMIASKVAATTAMNLRNQIYNKVMHFSNAEMDKFSTASLITRNTNDVQQIQMVMVILLRMVLYAPILGVGGILKVVNTDVSMSWIIVAAVAIIICLVLVLFMIAMPKFQLMQTLVDKVNLVAREILTGLSVIRAFSTEHHEEKRFDRANTELAQTQLFTNRVMTFMMPAMMFLMNAISIAIVWFGSKRIDTGNMQVGQMMAFLTYAMQIVMSFLMITMISIMLPRAGVAAKRIDEVINTPISITNKLDTKKPLKKGVITFDHVTFKYPNAAKAVLENIDFTAKPGETTAFIGSTGSGKSTLVNLIPRFYDVTSGSIKIDGIDVRDMKLTDLRDMLGYVPQKGILFSGTIESNIKYGAQSINDDKVKKAAKIAQATEFIDANPDGYDRSIAQGGTNVSGGQKQRLSIARAIAKNPKIYIFDDSFSALDFKTDVTLRKALQEQTKDSTVLIVAQRISTILNAEQIIVLDEGRIVGKGTHSELLANCEVYRQIATSQLSEKELEESL